MSASLSLVHVTSLQTIIHYKATQKKNQVTQKNFVLIGGLFNDHNCSSGYIVSKGGTINDEQTERSWIEMVVA